MTSDEVLTSDYMRTLGEITNEFAGLERLLMVTINFISSIRTWEETVCLIGGENFDILTKKFDKIAKFILLDEPSTRTQFLDMVKTLNAINEDRNKYLHSLWRIDPYGPIANRTKFVRAPSSGRRLMDQEDVPIDILKKLVDDIRSATDALQSLVIGKNDTINKARKRRVEEFRLEFTKTISPEPKPH